MRRQPVLRTKTHEIWRLSSHVILLVLVVRIMKQWDTHKFKKVVVFARQQSFLFALHVFDRLLEKEVFFGHDFVEDRDSLPALCRAFHTRRHKCMIHSLACCLSAGSILFSRVFLFVSSAVAIQTTRTTDSWVKLKRACA